MSMGLCVRGFFVFRPSIVFERTHCVRPKSCDRFDHSPSSQLSTQLISSREVIMDVALVGAELEENLGLRYMAAALEARGHRVEIVAFNSEADLLREIKLFDALWIEIIDGMSSI